MPHSGVQLQAWIAVRTVVAVFCGETEIGQGSDSVLAACVAEVLGIDLLGHSACASPIRTSRRSISAATRHA